jgi:thioredoxin reductase (NADPH)
VTQFTSLPFILLIDPREDARSRGEAFLRADCASSFEVEAVGSLDQAESTLERVAADSGKTALLLLRYSEDERRLREVLQKARTRTPGVEVVLYDDGVNPPFGATAKREGLVDYTIEDPWESPEVSLGPILRDALRAWESDTSGSDVVRIIGDPWQPRCHDLKDLLARHRVAYRWVDAAGEREEEARESTMRVVFPNGSELVDPTDEEIARELGFGTSPEASLYDIVIVGGGPAGLAAAVYASSEGLRTLIVERDVPGGQAGSSALIENYLGFPDGISGAELASRAVLQAEKFGTEILLTRSATALRAEQGFRVVQLDDGQEIVCHTVLLAMGIAYRRFEAAGAERLEGAGVYYGAASAEAARLRGRDVCLLGSGNSAAQAALLLARYVRRLTIITVDETLETTMSQYLVDRIRSLPNVRMMTETSVVEVKGEERVEAVVIARSGGEERRELKTDALFIWIGGKPRTEWLEGALVRDEEGFIVAGRDLRRADLRGWPHDRWPRHLETSMGGVFVAGDVRQGSAKRVGSAVGEGAMAVQLIHDFLRNRG